MITLAVYRRLLKNLKPYWFLFVIGFIATIIASGLDAAIAWAVKPLVDKGMIAREHEFLVWLPLLIIIIFTVRGWANFASSYIIKRIGRSIVMDFRQEVFEHLLQLPADYYDHISSSKVLALLLYNVDQIAAASTDALLTVLQQGIMAIGLIVVMFIISWHLTLFFLIVAPVIAAIVHVMTRRIRMLSHSVQDSVAELTNIARESVDGYRVIRLFSGEEYERHKFSKANRLNRHRELKVVVTNALGTSTVQMIVALPMAVVIYFVTSTVISISVGGFGAMVVAVLRLLVPLKRLTRMVTNIQKGIAGAQSVYEVLDEPAEQDQGDKPLLRVNGKIEFQHVIFTYGHTQKTVLHDINLSVEPGQIVALVGHSGAGKSTLVHLLPRFYLVDSGEILLDGVNINNYRLADLRQQFSFVSQHITLFNDTIAHNIAYGKYADASEKEIIKVAKAAYIMHDIDELPHGLNTFVGENGLLLSGGQRQRLAIARALLKDAPILILDEATSALDSEAEQYLHNAIDTLMHKRTTLVIAHRLSTVEKADRIIVLDQGHIVEEGSHKELLKQEGYYAKLYRMQFSDE